MKRPPWRAPLRVALSTLLLLCAPASTGLSAEMFEGRTVTILVSGSPGGGDHVASISFAWSRSDDDQQLGEQ